MGQKINPIGLRLGIIRGWDSNWYGGKDYGDKLVEDEKIRNYLRVRIPKGGIAKVVIERTLKRITLTIHTSRPGIVIGKGGGEVDAIREEIKKITGMLVWWERTSPSRLKTVSLIREPSRMPFKVL
jgi:small subunit ribosomal protein S3